MIKITGMEKSKRYGTYQIMLIFVVGILFSLSFYQSSNGEVLIGLTLESKKPDSFATTSLHWNAPGDDSVTGTAKEYDIRCRQTAITLTNWDSCSRVIGVIPKPETSGTFQSMIVKNLDWNSTYYFGMRSVDESGNWSGISNIAIVYAGFQPPPESLSVWISIYEDSVTWIPRESLLYQGEWLRINEVDQYQIVYPGLIAGVVDLTDSSGNLIRTGIHLGILSDFRYNTNYLDTLINGLDLWSLFQKIYHKK